MASWKDLVDNTLEALYLKKPFDAEAARKPIVRGIDRTLEQFLSTEVSKAPNKWWKVNNSIVAFSAKLPGGQVLQINERETNFIPSERFPDFLKAFKKAVEAGEFDKELKRDGEGDATVPVPTTGETVVRKRRQETPEEIAARTAKRLKTIADKKAAAAKA